MASPEFDPGRLSDALARVHAGAWSLPSTFAATGVHHGYRRVVLVGAGRLQPQAEPFGFVLDEFAPVLEAWLSWIDPGGFIAPHRDAGPWRDRWQVPICAAGEFHMGQTFTAVNGHAFQVTHWEPHAVVNRTGHPRIHLVVDRAVWLEHPAQPFATYPIPESMTDLVDVATGGHRDT